MRLLLGRKPEFEHVSEVSDAMKLQSLQVGMIILDLYAMFTSTGSVSVNY